MKDAIKLFLILITLTVFVFAWITHQLGNPRIQILIAVLAASSLAAFFIMNLMDHREQRKKRAQRESASRSRTTQEKEPEKRSDTSFSLRDRKSGLTWGGGNIKASEATRGTKRKFLGK